jgi:dipeptidyl aminopeptidase/acylaminoacyl peptidase
MKARAPYGTWPSFISAAAVAEAASRPGDLVVDGLDIYIGESRPDESGRVAIVKLASSAETQPEDVLPAPYSARSRVHEYGGGAFNVRAGSLVFIHDADQALYLRGPGERPRRLSPVLAGGQRRFAEPIFDTNRERILAIVEEHGATGREPENFVAAVGYGGRTGRFDVLLRGQHFYSSLRLSPDHKRLAWLSWRHPCMPWDGTELWMAELDGLGLPKLPRLIAGGSSVSIFQPEWDAHGGLHFISDQSGFWNLYRWDATGGIQPRCPRPADFGAPQWVFGMSTYCALPDGDLLCALTEGGVWRLGRLSATTQDLSLLDLPYTEYFTLRSAPGGAALLVASPTLSTSLMHYDIQTGALRPLRRYGAPGTADGAAPDGEAAARISEPSPVEYLSEDGMQAYGLFYPPRHPEYEAPSGEKPPLLVRCHGGPTSQASTGLNLRTQYWTSRGFAVLEVNYRGSSGYGRAYRDALRGQWGVGEVLDCIAGANALAERGLCDRNRLTISGGSAGGYTSLAALTFHDAFAAGAIYYGVSDLSALARDTHKFESRYLEGLVGPYPEMAARYTERSPLSHLDRLERPVAFFHGMQDKVTPPNQATTIVKALEEKGVPVAFLSFADEGHGFRHAETIRRTLDGEYYFYCRIFGIEPADAPEKIDIKNLARR